VYSIKELERAARPGLSGAMIAKYPLEDQRYERSGRHRGARNAAEPAQATRRQGKIRGAGPGTLRDASSRATKAFCPTLSMCDMIFSGVFERHPRLTLAIVEFELAPAAQPRLRFEVVNGLTRRPSGQLPPSRP
jgi:hypothetical protein